MPGGSITGRFAQPLFLGWTLFAWFSRLRNQARKPGGLAEAGLWTLGSSAIFISLAAFVTVAALLSGRFGPARVVRPVSLNLLVALTIGFWLFRAPDIIRGDHSAGFIVLHVALGVVSVGLALMAWRFERADRPGRSAPVRYHGRRWVSQ